MKPYLLRLKENFTKYELIYTLHFKSKYSIRLYELLYSYANMTFIEGYTSYTYEDIPLEKNEVCFSIDYLREYFNCKDKYPNTGDFIKRVIGAGITDINENTVYPCSYRTIRKRNKITHIVFIIGEWNSQAGAEVIARLKERESKKQ